jgi:hypothetical protein
MKTVIRSDKPVYLLLLLWSHKCNFGAEPRSYIIATSAVKGFMQQYPDISPLSRKELYSVIVDMFTLATLSVMTGLIRDIAVNAC